MARRKTKSEGDEKSPQQSQDGQMTYEECVELGLDPVPYGLSAPE